MTTRKSSRNRKLNPKMWEYQKNQERDKRDKRKFYNRVFVFFTSLLSPLLFPGWRRVLHGRSVRNVQRGRRPVRGLRRLQCLLPSAVHGPDRGGAGGRDLVDVRRLQGVHEMRKGQEMKRAMI